MMFRWFDRFGRKLAPLAVVLVVAGCGAEQFDAAQDDGIGGTAPGEDYDGNEAENNDHGNHANDENDGDFDEPEDEEFVVEQVAATESYVFVPNQTEGSETVALIDGRDFGVQPVQVGLQPEKVQAADIEDQGAVGYVLSTGQPTVSVIRADVDGGSGVADVQIRSVPSEVNELTLSPDGEHLLAYIDPDEPINVGSSAASLQTMALLRLGSQPGEEQVFELSVTPYIDDIIFTDDGNQAFIAGADGIHRMWLNDVKSDMVVPSLQLESEGVDVDGDDREVAVTADGGVLALRNGDDAGVALYALGDEGGEVDDSRVVELAGAPSDLELIEDDESRMVVAPIRSEQKVVTFDVDEALDADEGDDGFINTIDASGADAGISRFTPDESAMVTFSTVPEIPTVGLVDIDSGQIETHRLRNQIRNLEISPDSQTAVAVHQRQEGSGGSDPEEAFRHSEGLTLWDLESGYLRPITLHGYPEQIVMVSDSDERAFLYVMLVPSEDDPSADAEGVMRINLRTHATEFYGLPRLPNRLGAVADQVFVGQDQESGRITFFDVDTGQQRTISGYELNAGIE